MGQSLQVENMRRAVPTAAVLLLLLQLCLLDSASAYCSQGSDWMEFNGKCYHWTRSGSNWFNAELVCQNSGGHLVSINSTGENNFLRRLTQCRHHFWIGMVNTVYSLRGHVRGFEWWDRSPHSFTALITRGISMAECVHCNADGNWYDSYCQTGNGFVCKAPVAAAQQEQQKQKLPKNKQQGLGADEATRRLSSVFKSGTAAGEPAVSTRMWPTTPSTVASASSLKCPKDWHLMDSSCYFVSEAKTNYFKAQMSCQAMGASVSSILTAREHTLLTVALGCDSPIWIGLEKARPCFTHPSKDHCWVWMDGSPLDYLEWAPGQNLDQRDAECAILDDQWKVQNCHAERRYLCKRPAHGAKSSSN